MMIIFTRWLAILLVAFAMTACGSSSSSSPSTTSSAIIGMTLSADGNTLYVANADKHVIQAVNLATAVVSTYAGGEGLVGATAGTGTAARFYEPFSVVRLGSSLYVADTFNQGIRKIDSSQVVTTLAGKLGYVGAIDDTGIAAIFNYPKGITTDGTDFYVADTANYLIRKVTAAGAVTGLAGSSGQSGYVDGAAGSGTKFGTPFAVAATSTHVYVSDSSNHSIRSVRISDGTVATLAGSTSGTSGSTDSPAGPGTTARFNTPAGIATDGTNVYVADSGNHTIRKIVIATGVVSTIAGTAGSADSTDAATGPGTTAKFNNPIGLALDAAGTTLYVSDQNYTKVRKIALGTGVVTTLSATF